MMQGRVTDKREYEIYEQIIVKFLINLPNEQRDDQARLSFHVQKAWYYYLDSVLQVKDDSNISSKQRYQFFENLRHYGPKSLNINPDLIISKLAQNKPTCGAIIMNQQKTKILVIKNKNQKMGFPKGKWNQSQKPEQCAARQVQQQTGVYIHTKIDPKQKIQFFHNGNVPTIFFVVNGVKECEKLNIDKKQIQEVFWMTINDITRFQKTFVLKSRIAWRIYLQSFNQPKLSIQQFVKHKPRKSQIKRNKQSGSKKAQNKALDNLIIIEQKNPFLDFKLNKQQYSHLQVSFSVHENQ